MTPDNDHADEADEAPPIEEADVVKSRKRDVRIPLSALGWGAGVLASVLLLAFLGYLWWWPDQRTNDDAQGPVTGAAKEGVAAVYTYSAQTIDRDISSAQSHLTGDFLSEYKQYAEGPTPNEAKQNAVKTAATVVGAGLMDMKPSSAHVLVFINQTTTSAQNPATTLASRSVIVTLMKVDGKWLISSLKPA